MEKEMEEKLMENRLKYESKMKEKLIRMTPEWKALKYDKEQDFAVRMALRKEENKIREENHLKSMESMYGRVYSMPPLFDHERFHNFKNWVRTNEQTKLPEFFFVNIKNKTKMSRDTS